MINLRTRKRATALVASVGIAAALTAGCSNREGQTRAGEEATSSPGITDTTVTLGITTPLSGGTAGPGNCTVNGIKAYFGAKNAEGGVKFGDGKTRKVEIQALDDTYDPQKAASNYDSLKGKVFLMTSGLGTPTNRAWRDAAIADKVPQVLIMTGDKIFSNKEESPMQIGFVPIYANEGQAFGEVLAKSTKPHKVAILAQNDDFGEGYVEGFKEAIKGKSNIQIVKELTYEATDTSVDAQITELASTKADVIFNAMSVTPLVISAMQKAQEVNWSPSWFQPSNTSSPGAILGPANAKVFPGVYSVSFSQNPLSPADAEDADVKKFVADLKQYAGQNEPPQFPHCMWSYMIGGTLEQAFGKMTKPTRDDFMTQLRTIKDYQAPLMLEGTSINTTVDGQPAVSTVNVVKYNGKGFAPAETFGD